MFLIIYRENFQKVLKADPTVVNLRDKSFYYYEVAEKICVHINDKELISLMAKVFLSRVQGIQRKSFCVTSEELTSFMKKLTSIERQIFENGKFNMATYKSWKDSLANATSNTIVSQLRKKVKKG